MLYLGEINSSQEQAWRKSIEVFDERSEQLRSLSLFPEDRIDAALVDESVVRLCLSQLRLCVITSYSIHYTKLYEESSVHGMY